MSHVMMRHGFLERWILSLALAGLLWSLLASAPPAARADDTFRCGSEIVNAGDTSGKVYMRCGAPTWKEPVGYMRGYQESQLWYYNCGANDYLYVLHFVGGRLQYIESQGYGTGESDCYGPGRRHER